MLLVFFVSISLSATAAMAATAATVTTAPMVTAEQRLSEERLPREPGPSTDDERPWPVDAQGHHYRNDPQPSSESQQQQQATTSTDMITVAARGSRSLRPKPRTPLPASPSILFPVDVTDRLRSPVMSLVRPRQFGRRRSVQDAIASAVAQQQLETASAATVVADPDADRVPDPNEEQEQDPRLVTPFRLVLAQIAYLFKLTYSSILTYSVWADDTYWIIEFYLDFNSTR